MNIPNHSQFIDSQKTKRLKEKSGAALEYAEEGEISVDIYKDSWPLAEHMMWFIPACARDADSVSLGDGESHSNSAKTSDVSVDAYEYEYGPDRPPSSCSIASGASGHHARKFRSKNDAFESTFQNVASSFTAFLDKQAEAKSSDTIACQQTENQLKYTQMYEELDKTLENATFLDAIKFLTSTIEAAKSKFSPKFE